MPALQCLLWDALGFPRDLVRHCQRNWARNLVKADAAWQAKVIRYWPSRAAWSGSALKLYPLALVLAAGKTSAPSPAEVRNALGKRGLSRNAWALLYRMPAEVIELMAMDLEVFSAPHLQERYLKWLSLWCARLGRAPRYYRAGIRKVACALLWPVRELVLLTCEDANGVYSRHDRHLAMVMVWERLAGMVTVLRRCTRDPDEVARLELLLQRFSDYLLTSEELDRQPFQRLHEVIDWFVVEGRRMPLQVLKRPYQQTLNLSMRWHDRQWREAQVRHNDDVVQSWTVALPNFEMDGGSFKALTTSGELALEGRLMQHCVGTYTMSCQSGRSLIYAVSFEGERVGTLELIANDSGQWALNQFKGVRNQQLAEALTEPASKLYLPYKAFLAALHASDKR